MKPGISLLSAIFVLGALTAFSRIAVASSIEEKELSADEIALIKTGQQVVHTQPVDGAPWPKIYVYQKISATPEEAEAVIGDYELSPSYMPDIVSCKIVQKVDKTSTDVETIYRVIITSEDITLRFSLSKAEDFSGYRTDWKLLKSTMTKSIEGNTRLEPFDGGTLMAYYMFTVPGVSLGGAIAREAIKQVQLSSAAFAAQVESEVKSNPTLLNQQIAALRSALAP